MDYTLKIFSFISVLVVAAVVLATALRSDEAWKARRMAKVPVPLDETGRRRRPPVSPPEDEPEKQDSTVLYVGFLLFVYLLLYLLRFG